MEWLRRFEGLRGIAYMVLFVACIAPTTLALFFLAPNLFAGLGFPQLVLLILCVGSANVFLGTTGYIYVASKSGDLHREIHERPELENAFDVAMNGVLVVGSAVALASQSISLIWCVANRHEFGAYIVVSFLATAAHGLLTAGFAAIRYRKRKSS